MRVILIAHNLQQPNGVVSATRNLHNALVTEGHHVEYWIDGVVDPEFDRAGIVVRMTPWDRLTTHIIDFPNSNALLRPIRSLLTPFVDCLTKFRLARKLRLHQDAILIGADIGAFIHLSQILDISKQKMIIQVHSSYQALSSEDHDRIRRGLRIAGRSTVLSDEDGTLLKALLPGEFYTMPNIVDLGQPSLPYSPERRSVVFAGRFAEEKQVDHLIQAFLASNHDGWTLDLYGTGPLLPAMQERYSNPSIHFHGHTNDISMAFSRAAVNILSSKFEGAPMAIVEAAQLGVPTISYDLSAGVRMTVGDGGILVPRDDINALTHALDEFYSNATLRSHLSTLALKNSEQFRAQNVYQRWMEVIDSI